MTISTPKVAPKTDKPSWGTTLRVYLEPASLRMLSLGFSAEHSNRRGNP